MNGSETVDTVSISGSIFASMNYYDYLHFHFSIRFYKIRENGKKKLNPSCADKGGRGKRVASWLADTNTMASSGFIKSNSGGCEWMIKTSTAFLPCFLLIWKERLLRDLALFGFVVFTMCHPSRVLSPTFPPEPDLHICTEAVLRVLTFNCAHGLASGNPAPADRKHPVLSTPEKPFLLTPSDLFKTQRLSTLTS